jgi:lipoyl-dependent peroxiredoxin
MPAGQAGEDATTPTSAKAALVGDPGRRRHKASAFTMLTRFAGHVIFVLFPTKEDEIMERKAGAVWNGGLKDGKGILTTASGVLTKTPYSFSTRFENAKGTNPEELIAAAHAGCFSMALSAELGKAGLTPDTISTEATLTMEKKEAGFTITKIHLEVSAKVPSADQAKFQEVANNAKKGCPVSRVLNAEITMNAKLL